MGLACRLAVCCFVRQPDAISAGTLDEPLRRKRERPGGGLSNCATTSSPPPSRTRSCRTSRRPRGGSTPSRRRGRCRARSTRRRAAPTAAAASTTPSPPSTGRTSTASGTTRPVATSTRARCGRRTTGSTHLAQPRRPGPTWLRWPGRRTTRCPSATRCPVTSPGLDVEQITGLPTWLWLAPGSWGEVEARAEIPGFWVEVTAHPERVVWDMGDGETVVCAVRARPTTRRSPTTRSRPTARTSTSTRPPTSPTAGTRPA